MEGTLALWCKKSIIVTLCLLEAVKAHSAQQTIMDRQATALS